MKYSTVLVLAASATLSYAQNNSISDEDTQDDYLAGVCLPSNATGYPDFDAPCNAVMALEYECTFGPAAGLALINQIFGPDDNSTTSINSTDPTGFDSDNGPAMQDNSTQRACICESQFFNQLSGCLACQSKHGDDTAASVSPSYISSVSSSYCAATFTPTLAFADFLASIPDPTSMGSNSSAASTASATSFSDPIGNKTAVSLYFTPSVTGTAAYMVSEATGASGIGSISSVHTSSGQIVPTASANNAAAGGSGASSSSTSHAGAQKTQAAAVAGMIGLAGLVAFL